jgi:hypothetical protein
MTVAPPDASVVNTPAVTPAATNTPAATPASTPAAVATTVQPAATPSAPIEIKLSKVDGVPESEIARVSALAKEMGWDQATASKYYDNAAKAHLADVAAIKNDIAQGIAKFEAENKAHPVYGGDKYAETDQRIQQALAFAGDEGKALAEFLTSQDNAIVVPQVRNFLAKIGYSLGEGRIVTPGSAAVPKAPLSERMFGKSAT